VLVELAQAVELLDEVERDVGLPVVDRRPDRLKLVQDPEDPHVVADLPQGGHDVVLGLPLGILLLRPAVAAFRRHERRMGQDQNAKLPHSAIQLRRL
jgi:hypothetical protein